MNHRSLLSAPSFDLRTESHWLALGILLACGILDALLAWLGGNRSTLSRMFLDAESHQAALAFNMAYAAAVLVWHLTVVSTRTPDTLWLSILKAVVVVTPILLTFVGIAVTPPQDDTWLQKLAGHRVGIITLVILGTCAGWVAAYWGVSQHVGAT